MNTIRWAVLGTLVGVLASFASCGAPRCDAKNCAFGCCDANGVCQGGQSDTACGTQGASCDVCTTLERCQLGTCLVPSGGTGGGSGSNTGGGGGTSAGDITFSWTLNGQGCAAAPAVTQIVVEIPGQSLANNGVYGCLNAGTQGIRLTHFAPGVYSYTLRAVSSLGATLFSASGSVVVNGSVQVNVTLLPTTSAPGTAWVAWSLPVGSPVTCQYLEAVELFVDDAQVTSRGCAAGLYNPGTSSLQGVALELAPGPHTLRLDARDAQGLYYYRKQISLEVSAGQTTQQVVALDWLVGTAALRWTFSNGVTQLTCAQAGVSTVGVTFRDASGDLTQEVPCQLATSSGTFDGYTPYVYGGTYQVFLAAFGTGGAIYRSSTVSPQQVTTAPGVFPALTSATPQILMSLQ
ncbi:MAG: hypothetical protein ACOZQL_06490 [Myxococcota bacterium]